MELTSVIQYVGFQSNMSPICAQITGASVKKEKNGII